MTVPTLTGSMLPIRATAAESHLVVLGPSLGTTSHIWDNVATRLSSTFRVMRYDLPGHGSSPSTSEAFSIAELGSAVLELVDSVGGGSFSVAGDSLGGAVALALAAEHPERVTAAAAFAVTATFGESSAWLSRATKVRTTGTASLVASSASRWFGPAFLDRHPDLGANALDRLLEVDDESYALCCDALATFDFTSSTSSVSVPVILAGGEFDIVTPADDVEQLAELIPGAQYELIAGAGHLPVLEAPTETEQIIRSVIPETNFRKSGEAVRRAVLGDAHVNASNAAMTPETADFQDFITRYAWGDVWARPGLSKRDRSLITLASLITSDHHNETGMHVHAAITNGVTRAEISELILHTALYAGLPAANAASAIARDIFARLDEKD